MLTSIRFFFPINTNVASVGVRACNPITWEAEVGALPGVQWETLSDQVQTNPKSALRENCVCPGLEKDWAGGDGSGLVLWCLPGLHGGNKLVQ